MKSFRRKKMLLIPAVLYIMVNVWILGSLYALVEYENLISLSYSEGAISADTFLRWKESEGSSMTSEAAVWKADVEEDILSDSTGQKRKVSCYQFAGQPSAVFAGALAGGRYFTGGEEGVCLLDKETVRQLFGSEDVIGLEVQKNGRPLRIVGILEESRPVCIQCAEKNTLFDAVTVRKKDTAVSSSLTVSMLEAVLGGADGEWIDGKLYTVSAWLFYAVVTSVSLILAGSLCSRAFGKRDRNLAGGLWLRRCILFFFLETAVLVFLWGVRMAAPGSDYLPTYWSDFEFFSGLFKEKAEQVRGLMMHQEFSVWTRMTGLWMSAAGGGFALIIFDIIILTFLKIKVDFN